VSSIPLRALVARRPAEDRVFYHNIWFRGHNNARYAALLPRLPRIDPYLVTCSERRFVRGLQFRALWRTRAVRNRVVLGTAGRRYRFLFSTDPEQIPHFRGPVVVDVDDPVFTPREAWLLNRPNVRAYVVTSEGAAGHFRELGVTTPHHVFPQGVDLATIGEGRREEVGQQKKRPGEVVIGYMAAWLLTDGDHDGDNQLYNIDHLLELWGELHSRLPQARLWLVGEPSRRVRRLCAGRPDIELLGRLPPGEALAHVANFDVALFCRTRDQGVSTSKVASYMGLGVPTVGYALGVTRMLDETGAGVTVTDARAFVAAVERLATQPGERARMAAAARAAGRALDWDELARRYDAEVLDVHLR